MIVKTLLMFTAILSLVFLFRFVVYSFKVYEEPSYTVVNNFKEIQIRQYQDFNLASTDISGRKETALKQGFRRLAGYIFGKNSTRQLMDMTIPVMFESNISSWRISFMLPRAYAFDALPRPDDARVFLHAQSGQNYAVIRFSGARGFENFIAKRLILEKFLTKNHCFNQGRVIYAFYNPPWTLPFLRRNEVWVELTKVCQLESLKDEK